MLIQMDCASKAAQELPPNYLGGPEQLVTTLRIAFIFPSGKPTGRDDGI